MTDLAPYILYPLILAISLVLSLLFIPRIIYVAKKKRLFDVPDNNRKIHVTLTPNLGGLGIFFAFFTTASFFITGSATLGWHYIICSCFILFLTGVYDDLIGLNASRKFLAQFAAAFITVYFADIRITSLEGILGIYELPTWLSISFTVVGCTFVTNAINLIDGIDGLAGGIAALCSLLLGAFLFLTGNTIPACIAICLMGAIIGFLKYNISPARIFMGDTGSLFIGFMISVLAILLVRNFRPTPLVRDIIHSQQEALIVALAVLFVPVFDSFRVFINRARKGMSPFKADRTHLHHYLIDAGFTHSESVSILLLSNVLILTLALLTQGVNPNISILCIVAVGLLLVYVLARMRRSRLARNQALIQGKDAIMPLHGTDMTAHTAR